MDNREMIVQSHEAYLSRLLMSRDFTQINTEDYEELKMVRRIFNENIGSSNHMAEGLSEVYCFKLNMNERTSEYYDSIRRSDLMGERIMIFFFFESSKGIFWSNCDKLIIDEYLKKGIRKIDLEKKSVQYYEYLSILDQQVKQW